jgi:hypothetical protein
MAVEEIKAKRWTCDGCGKSVKTEAHETPEGYHGTVELTTKKGEIGGIFYACKRGCIQMAVRTAVGDGPKDVFEADEPDVGVEDDSVDIRTTREGI